MRHEMEAAMKRKNRCAGFTLVELMMSMLAMAVLLLATGSILVYGWLGWRRNMESVSMQRDATIAMKMIARDIRNSNISDVSGDAAGIYFNGSSFLAADIAISPGVNMNNFEPPLIVSNTVVVAFTLNTSDNADENRYRILVNTRN